MSDNADKRTATQRIEDLEKVVTMLYQATAQSKNALENLLRAQSDMALVKDALKLLNKKTEAIIQCATPETGITVQAVSALVVKMNVEDLTAQVAGFVTSGHLTPTDEVAADSYLVCEELAADGTQVNPRIQFRLDSQDASTQEAFKGKKVGDTVSFGENKFSAKLLELYSLTEPKAPDAAPAAEAAPTAPAPAAEAAAPTTADAAPAEAAPTGPSNANFENPPAETPVAQFVPSDSSAPMTTASA
jgi:hypothetical protein